MGIMGAEQKSWTYEQAAFLRSHWETHTASAIAAKVGHSRNAVISKAHRLGLPKKGRPVRKKSAPKRAKPQKPRTFGRTNQLSARLAMESAEAIQVRRASSQTTDTGAGFEAPPAQPAPVPFAPRSPKPYIESILSSSPGCQWPVERAFPEPGEHIAMLVCDDPRDGESRYCPYHAEFRVRAA